MKPILIYFLVMTLVWAAILIALAPKAHAESSPRLATRFALVVNVDGAKKVYTEPTPPGKKLALPEAFNSVDCVVTHVVGTDQMWGLICSEQGSNVVFRSVVSCSTAKASSDTSSMAVSVGDDTARFLFGCETKKADTSAKPAPTSI